jgi:hypothetical protein
MLVMSNSQPEVEQVVNELTKLSNNWNLRLNKKKSEILTNEDLPEIGGVKCVKVVKYLGVRVAVDKKEQNRVTREQIDKNIKLLRWRLGRADSNVIE